MDCNLYFGHISGVENRVSFQKNVRYSEVVAKRGSDGRAVPKIHTKSGAARAPQPPRFRRPWVPSSTQNLS